jgi:uncharacterized membrane protein HdeD (DUF308 family)
MKKFIKKTTFILLGLFLPVISFAQGAAGAVPTEGGGNRGRTAMQILQQATEIIQNIIPIVIGLALLVFLWGVFKYIFAGDATAKKESIQYITWGIIALFVMVSIWGLVILLQKSFLGESDPSQPPQQEVDQLQQIPRSEGSGLAGGSPILNVIKEVGDTIASMIPILLLIGVLIFLWGVFKYAFSNDSKNKESAKQFMLWGIIALAIMAFVWGFVIILQQTVFKSTNPSELGTSQQSIDEMTQDPKIEGGTTGSGGDGINKVILAVMDIVQKAIPLLITIGTLLFIWGVFKYVTTENSKKKSEAVAFISWGIVLLLVMAAVWGLVKVIGDSVDVRIGSQPTPTSGAKINYKALIRK